MGKVVQVAQVVQVARVTRAERRNMSRKQQQHEQRKRFKGYKARHAKDKADVCPIGETLDWYSELMHDLRDEFANLPEDKLALANELIQKAEEVFYGHDMRLMFFVVLEMLSRYREDWIAKA